MTARGWFVTGTDTGVGKTVIAAALTRRLVERGERCAVMKPVASGCAWIDGALRNDDAETLRRESNVDARYETTNPYAFEPPIAPHLAASEAGAAIDFEAIGTAFATLAAQADFVVVEGVGGWLVPLDDLHTQADLAVQLGLPVLLVVGLRLGCLNHALLSAAAIERYGLGLAGWIATGIDPGFTHVDGNLRALGARIRAPRIAHVPPCPGAAPVERAAACLDLARLLEQAAPS
ncbi:dethiobiotin synthase [soil metagenome]